jgi:hypothetical protein
VNLATAYPEAPAAGFDSWLALGVPPRTALSVVVTAPVVPPLDEDVAAPAESIDMGMHGQGPARPAPSAPQGWRDKRVRED